ncbi:MAG TPA: DUF2784 domain-containing protein [Acidimicrobiia bacterium]|nr:DUF2784 domain-containing protein [Acidimicrobiia bacterium]
MDTVWIGLADGVLVVHLAYLAFIPLGGFLAWRRPRLVWVHLVAIAVGVVSITIGFDCPLTSWEQSFRRRGGQRPYRDGFVDHYLTGRVYPHGYEWAVWLVFGAGIAAAYALRPSTNRDSAVAAKPGEVDTP